MVGRGRALRAWAAVGSKARQACALRVLASVCSLPRLLGQGPGGRCRARPGRGLGAALGYGRARSARGALGLRAAGCSLGFLPPAAGARGLGPRSLCSFCCPPGARPPRLVLHCPLAEAGVKNRSCFFPRAPGRGPHARSALRERSSQCSWSLPFRFPTLSSCGCSLGLRLCLFSLVSTLGEGAD